MQRSAWVGTAVLCLLAAAFAAIWVAGPAASGPAALEALGDRGRWEFAWPEQDSYRDLPERFDLDVRMTLAGGEGSAVRMLLNASDPLPDGAVERAAFVDVTAAGVAVGRVEGGFVLPLGRASLAAAPGAARQVTIKRRGAELAVAVDGRLALAAFEPHLHGGRVGIARAGGGTGEVWPVRRLPEFPEFSDDFMRTPDEPGPWTAHSGEWKIDALLTPSMSANGFTFRGRAGAGPALASAGEATWDRYRVEASMRGEEGGAMGLAFAFAGTDRYCLFRWRAEGAGGGSPERELVEVVDDEPGPDGAPVERIVASSRGGYRPGEWYRVTAVLGFGHARVLVDDHEAFSAELEGLVSGAVALWASGAKGASFDDVLVTPDGTVEESFAPRAVEAGARQPGADRGTACSSGEPWRAQWEAISGEWQAGPDGLVARAEGEAKLLTGSPEWRRASVQVEADAADGACGLVINYLDESEYVALRIADGRARLVRVAGGATTLMDEAACPGKGGAGRGLLLGLASDDGYLVGRVGGERLVEGYDEKSLRGRAGLWSSGDRATFRSFRARFLPHERPVSVVNSVFEVDNIMVSWAGENADWYPGAESKSSRRVFWRREPFHGDVELAMDLPGPRSPAAGARLALGIAKSGDQPGNGYAWSLEAGNGEGAKGGPGWHCRMVREGVEVADVPLDSGYEVESLFVRRRGRYVVAGVNGEILRKYRDDEPLDGSRVAFLAAGLEADPSCARVYGGLVHDYRFTQAPSEWRVGSGVWEIANRWKCDPRWSFLVGSPVDWPESKAEEKVVAVWNKRRFPGDVVVDFFIGPRMDTSDPPKYRRYEYVRDLNVTISADGRDLSSGYTFILGGFGPTGNEKSAILRGGRILAEDKSEHARYPRDSMVGHQQWYRIRAERAGNRLVYRAYFMGHERVSLEAEDPDPLDGDRVAIWSYDCPIVIARLRIAGSDDGSIEDPASAPRCRPRTPYDVLRDEERLEKEVLGEEDLR